MASQFTLHLSHDQGTVSFSFSPEAARTLKAALAELLSRLKAVAARASGEARPAKEDPMEFRHTGEVFLELYCNPNIWPSPFAAKLMVTVRDERIRVSGEAELPRVVEDLNLYLEQAA